MTADHCSSFMWCSVRGDARVVDQDPHRTERARYCFTPSAHASNALTSHLYTGMPVSDLNLAATVSFAA